MKFWMGLLVWFACLGSWAQPLDIPDPRFKAYLVEQFDTDGNGEISAGEALAVTEIDCSGLEIADLTGIRFFTQLERLTCSNNRLAWLPDLSALTPLTYLECDDNLLSQLPNLTLLPNLRTLYCAFNQITVLPDLTRLTGLVNLDVSGNELLAVPGLFAMVNLRYFDCSYNQITSLVGVSGLTGLEYLLCSGNELTNLPSLNALTSLRALLCEYNFLETLPDLSNLIALEYLYCSGNFLDRLPDLSKLKGLQALLCDFNGLQSLPDLSSLTALEYLFCSGNFLTSLPDLSALTQLKVLLVDYNELSYLPDLSKLTRLEYLFCCDNFLQTLPDLNNLTNLKVLRCDYNQLRALPSLASLTSLETLSCGENQLTSLPDLSKLSQLQTLVCAFNALTDVPDVSQLSQLNALHIDNNFLTEQDCPDVLNLVERELESFFYNPQFGGDLECKAVELGLPEFVSEANTWITEAGDLAILLPNPNADGFDGADEAGLSYVVTLEQGCNVVYGPVEYRFPDWPQAVTIPGSALPGESYVIGVARQSHFPNKKNTQSEKSIIGGPNLDDVNTPTTRREYNRWLLHIPRRAGGFDGAIQIANANPSHAVTVLLVGYDGEGVPLVSESKTLGPGEVKRYAVYEPGDAGIFYEDLGMGMDDMGVMDGASEYLDTISHVAIWERTRQTEVSVEYIAQTTGFPVSVKEINVRTEPVNGSEFIMYGATPNADYFDAVAILSLKSNIETRISVERRDQDGRFRGELDLGIIQPGEKLLRVLSGAFSSFVPSPVYTIRSIAPAGKQAPIQVLGLSGIRSGAFFKDARVVRKK